MTGECDLPAAERPLFPCLSGLKLDPLLFMLSISLEKPPPLPLETESEPI